MNLFYLEPDPDRWLPFDRYPRQVLRRIVRGRPRVGGQKRVFLNLCLGLDQLGVQYRVNDFRYARQHPDETVGIVGKPFVLDLQKWRNPILFGASLFSHPVDDPQVHIRLPVKRILVPGPWMEHMFRPYYGERVHTWPVGIDTEQWQPNSSPAKHYDFLLYDKIRWKREQLEAQLLQPLRTILASRGLTVNEIRYGNYQEADFRDRLQACKAMIFLCEHESQGIAYQQALSAGVPIMAWDRGGSWQDPSYYPDRVNFSPVSSVPYWDARCGVKFSSISEFSTALEVFLQAFAEKRFSPREYILENLTLKQSARWYLHHYRSLAPA